MTATTASRVARVTGRLHRARHSSASGAVVAPRQENPAWSVLSRVAAMLAFVLLFFVADVVLFSQVQHASSQAHLYRDLRLGLAEGSVPRGPFVSRASSRIGEPATLTATPAGVPLALLQVPRLGITEVVVEGSSSRQTRRGIGHQRDTVLPGQSGTSVLLGRAWAYGGVFKHLASLRPGDPVYATTSQGQFAYRVERVRRAGTPQSAPLEGSAGRITLVTADGGPYQPTDLVQVDARLVSQPVGPLGLVTPGSIPSSDQPMRGVGQSALVPVIFLLQALTAAVVLVLWIWSRLGAVKTWVVAVPLLGALALLLANTVSTLLPNVM